MPQNPQSHEQDNAGSAQNPQSHQDNEASQNATRGAKTLTILKDSTHTHTHTHTLKTKI
ncbi:hypothetical protein [Helicobacter sp. 23-1046]